MILSITLYSTNESLVSKDIVRSCLGLLDFTKLRVSRTIGPENYYEIERRYLDSGASKSPPKDISSREFTDVEEVCALIRSGSVLRLSVASDSQRWGEISRGISNYSQGTSVFFSSTTGFSFGPLDICDYFEDQDGQDDVRLIDVAQFSYFLTSDNYVGDWDALLESLESAEAFVRFRTDLERIVGPLTLRVDA